MTLKHIRILLLFIAMAAAAYAATARLSAVTSDAQTPGAQCGRACLQAKVDRHLALMGEFGNDNALSSSFRGLTTDGPALVSVVQDTYNQWSRPENYNPKAGVRPGEMRWRALYLLGELRQADARPFLYETARTPIPDCKKDEMKYADEYRVRLRAIAGLENLKAIEELKELHEMGGVLKNPTAASLFVLGVKVNNDVSLVEARKALADDVADYKDHNKGTGRPSQDKKPGKDKITVVRRPDTPSIRRQR